jgi:hypothetical protein
LIAEYVKQNQIILDDTKEITDALSKKLDAETSRATNAENANNKLITDHKADTSNPHKVTKSQVGLGNVDNTSDVNKPVSTAVQNALNNKVTKSNTADTNGLLNSLASEESTPTDADYYISQHAGGGTTTTTYHRRPMSALWAFIKSKCDSIYATVSTVNAHISNKSNPHGVTKSQVGLSNVDNTADSAKSVKYAASAGSATTATRATQDSSGQQIDSTYIKNLSVSGRTITYTRGNGTTGAITTQDTNTNTTYTLTKSGYTITLNGSDGSKTSVSDAIGDTTAAISNATIDSICV